MGAPNYLSGTIGGDEGDVVDKPLRDRLSELLTAAVLAPAARPPLAALLGYCRSAPGGGSVPLSTVGAVAWGAVGVPVDAGAVQATALLDVTEDASVLPRRIAEKALPEVAVKVEACWRALTLIPEQAIRPEDLESLLSRAAIVFNTGLYFEFHEILEEVWMALRDPAIRRLLQGLVQVAVALYHLERGNRRGARSLLRYGAEKLADTAPDAYGLDLDRFRMDVAVLRDALAEAGRLPPTLCLGLAAGTPLAGEGR